MSAVFSFLDMLSAAAAGAMLVCAFWAIAEGDGEWAVAFVLLCVINIGLAAI